MTFSTLPFRWTNESSAAAEGNSLQITAHPRSDWYIHPAGESRTANGAFYHTRARGDFVLRSRVSHPFASLFDACALMLWCDDDHWAKLCYEYNTGGEHCVVSMVTRRRSDGADGAVLEGNSIWLQLARKGDLFVMHYSPDGESFHRVRYFTLPCGEAVEVGLMAQSPTGPGGIFHFQNCSLESRTLGDVRKGI